MLDFVAVDAEQSCYFEENGPDRPHDREKAAAVLSPNTGVVVCRDCLTELLEAATGYKVATQLASWDLMRDLGAQVRAAKAAARENTRPKGKRDRTASAR